MGVKKAEAAGSCGGAAGFATLGKRLTPMIDLRSHVALQRPHANPEPCGGGRNRLRTYLDLGDHDLEATKYVDYVGNLLCARPSSEPENRLRSGKFDRARG